jgi:addiction module RelB/DinJ family antitoxin
MAMTTTINTKIAPDLKKHADAVLASIGLSQNQAITMFYRQLVALQKLPFNIYESQQNTPNKITIDAINEDISTQQRFKSVDDLMQDLNS